MFRTLFSTALAASAVLLTPSSASASLAFPYGLTPTAPLCSAFAPVAATFNYSSCLGSFDQNNLNQDLTNALASFGAGTLAFRGSSNDPGTFGPFTSNPTGVTGTLTFDASLSGPFVLILKAGNQFSMYYFANLTSTSSLVYDTKGTNLNSSGGANGLSHASLYGGTFGSSTNIVPEPSTYALMATGMIGLVGFARRRRQA